MPAVDFCSSNTRSQARRLGCCGIAGTAGHRGRSSNAFVKAALAEGGGRDRDEDLDDLDDFIVCQAERDYSTLFSSDFRFAMQ